MNSQAQIRPVPSVPSLNQRITKGNLAVNPREIIPLPPITAPSLSLHSGIRITRIFKKTYLSF